LTDAEALADSEASLALYELADLLAEDALADATDDTEAADKEARW
jgi:hypothetical protein